MEVINYEAGWKARLADDQFHTQFSVYYETFDDYQANFAEFDSPFPGSTTLPQETPRPRAPSGASSSAARRGWARSRWISVWRIWKASSAPSATVDDPFRPRRQRHPDNVVNLSGAEVPFAPPFTGNIGIAYDFKLGQFTLTPRVDFSHQDETQAALWPDPQVPSKRVISSMRR